MFTIGQKLYEVRGDVSNNPKKICMTDQDGVEWFRWEEPKSYLRIVTHEVIGITTSQLHGVAAQDAEPEHLGQEVIHLSSAGQTSSWHYEDDLVKYLNTGAYWFTDKASANKLINEKGI